NDLLAGEADEQDFEETELFDERLTNHIWATHINDQLTDDLTLRLLGRYGLRHYDAPFKHRNTRFWTIGPHLEWEFAPGFELLLGYHYERGRTNQHKSRELLDDISYINHYTSAELKIPLFNKLSAVLIFDYEHNIFTSDYPEDIHHNATENIYQGELEFLYTLNSEATIKFGWQYGNRKFNFEDKNVKNNNLWLGIEYGFEI
nr:porin family protein [Gammaproteobacteria bacterium]